MQRTFPIGEFIALRDYMRAKRKPRPKVRIIFFDEFLNEENDYLKNEIKAYLSVCDSIIRNRDNVRCYLVSNHISVLNPYFNYFGIYQLGKRFTRGKHDSLLEFTDSKELSIGNTQSSVHLLMALTMVSMLCKASSCLMIQQMYQNFLMVLVITNST